ncbi:hypothetical protein, partial [Azospirillum doebereinerae]
MDRSLQGLSDITKAPEHRVDDDREFA